MGPIFANPYLDLAVFAASDHMTQDAGLTPRIVSYRRVLLA